MSEPLTFTDQINIAWDYVRRPDGKPYTLNELSEITGISVATLSHLRTGRQTNPQLSTLQALCDFFKVPLRYFETSTEEECLALLASDPADDAPPPQLHEITFRALSLSEHSQKNLLTLIKWVEAAEREYLAKGEIPPLLEEDDDNK